MLVIYTATKETVAFDALQEITRTQGMPFLTPRHVNVESNVE